MRTMPIIFRLFWPQILIVIITWVVPGHHEPLPSLTRSLRRWCVARPGVEALWLPRTWVITHILVFIHIGHYAYWLSYLVITTHIDYHTKGCLVVWAVSLSSTPPPRRKSCSFLPETLKLIFHCWWLVKYRPIGHCPKYLRPLQSSHRPSWSLHISRQQRRRQSIVTFWHDHRYLFHVCLSGVTLLGNSRRVFQFDNLSKVIFCQRDGNSLPLLKGFFTFLVFTGPF